MLDDALTPDEILRFGKRGFDVPTTWGEAARVRILSQKTSVDFPYSSWGHRFPNGTLYDPEIVMNKVAR